MPTVSIVYEIVIAVLTLGILAWMWGNGFFSYLGSATVNATSFINVTGPFTGGSGGWASNGFTIYFGNGADTKYIVVAAAALIFTAIIVYYFAGEGSVDENEGYYPYYA